MLVNLLGLTMSVAFGPMSRIEALGEERMMWMRTFQCFACLGLIAFGLGALSCSSSTASIEQSWRSPSTPSGSLTNVVTLFPSRDDGLRRSVEDKLAHALAERGIRATPAYAVLAPDQTRDRATAISALRRAGYDGVVAMRLIGTEHKLEYDPTLSLYWTASAWGALVPTTIVRMEVDAYTLEPAELAWSALSKSVDPDGVGELVDDVANLAGRQLAEQHVIASRR